MTTKEKNKEANLRTKLRRWRKTLKQDAEIFGWKHTVFSEIFRIRVLDWVRDRWYNIKHFVNRYDTVEMRDLSRWEYYEPKTRMPEAILECVAEFVEQQYDVANSFEDKHIEWSSDEPHINAKKELIDIYNWWLTKWRNRSKSDPLNCTNNPTAELVMQKVKFEFEPCDFDEDGDPKYYRMNNKFSNLTVEERKIYDDTHKANRDWEDKLDQELEDMCIRAIKIRNYMWW